MNSYISWAVFLVVLGGLSWHYAGRPNLFTRLGSPKLSQPISQPLSAANTRKPKTKPKRGGVETVQNGTNTVDQLSSAPGISSKKRKIALPQVNGNGNVYSAESGESPGTDMKMQTKDAVLQKDKDFAREMAVARTGTQLAEFGKPDMSKKERRAQKQNKKRPDSGTESPSPSAGASSTTGADADDDSSPVASPPLLATSTAATSKSGDISDMIETPGAGPSILRLTDPVNPMPQSRMKQSSKKFEPAETKKQRQQRIKREVHRIQVEEAEKERRRLMEKQIRGARMAEGTSAQTRASAFKPPADNAWFSGPVIPISEKGQHLQDGIPTLLDTFEPGSKERTSVPSAARTTSSVLTTNPGLSTDEGRILEPARKEIVGEGRAHQLAPSGKDEKDWAKDLPIEEEQIRVIQDSEDSWTTVFKRDKKKALKPPISNGNGSSEASGAENSRTNGLAPKSATSSMNTPSSSSNSYHQLGDSGLQDSDWVA